MIPLYLDTMAFLGSSMSIILFVWAWLLRCSLSSSSNFLSLSVENPEHVIKSTNNNFTAGFYGIGENAYAFAIWFTKPRQQNLTVVWMANRDVLVNGKGSTLTLCRNGNLVLKDAGQRLTRNTSLVSSKSQTDPSSGFHKLVFDNDNVLRRLYDGLELSSIYWPHPWNLPVDNDYGLVFQRRLTIDSDGNDRVYSRRNWEDKWYVSWQDISAGCNIRGVCGENSFCKDEPYNGRTCLCLPGYRFKDESDSSLGCQPEFNLSCNSQDSRFLSIPNGDFYGYDQGSYMDLTFDECKKKCLEICCKGFQYSYQNNQFKCYPKNLLVNGNLSPAFQGGFHLRVPDSSTFTLQEPNNTKCEHVKSVKHNRVYLSRQGSILVKVLLWEVVAIGGFELACIVLLWCLTLKKSSKEQNDHHLTGGTGFRKYSYSELKEATKGFREEVGRGAGGIVYKGKLEDGRVAAIKRFNEANQIEKGKYKMLVYEYMENGSLATNLESNKSLDWRKRYEIALGTARGLAYLHEECLEWVFNCDIKPQNILLDSDYQPKVADFGLSKLQNRNDVKNPSFSRIRGTRGYMAPEWVFNLPITSKVDVYSYGIVVLEMITGKRLRVDGPDHSHHGRLVTWVNEKKKKGKENETSSWVEQIIDPTVEGSFDMKKVEVLVTVALQCVVEDRDARPSMSHVVEMLQSLVIYSQFNE
ncbi:hypothetical protein K1719_043488 [Acacia pycnantha]|nr:hypothetical protein K1719_043488 [Acacia pycnantha]